MGDREAALAQLARAEVEHANAATARRRAKADLDIATRAYDQATDTFSRSAHALYEARDRIVQVCQIEETPYDRDELPAP